MVRFIQSLRHDPQNAEPGYRTMLQEFLSNAMPILFFFLATLLAFGVSFMVERYRK
jgi:hypothetical protein